MKTYRRPDFDKQWEEIRSLKRELAKHKKFFRQISQMTLDHQVIDDHACVTADRLGKELEKVDPDWWKINMKNKYKNAAEANRRDEKC